MRAPDAPSGWPSAIAPPFTFVLFAVEAELLLDGEVLRRERLVDLEQIDVADLHAGAGERLRDAGAGPMPMMFGSTPQTPH